MSLLIALSLIQAATTAPAAVPVASAEDAKIVCKTLRATGSRLGGKRVCLPKSEWKRMHDETRDNMSELQDNNSKQGSNQ